MLEVSEVKVHSEMPRGQKAEYSSLVVFEWQLQKIGDVATLCRKEGDIAGCWPLRGARTAENTSSMTMLWYINMNDYKLIV